jgi:hypothetical protein
MKKMTKITLMIAYLGLSLGNVNAQNPFNFLKVNYVGAMGTTDWTTGWANWNPEKTVYPATNEQTTLNAGATPTGKIEISTTVTLDASKVYLLTGLVYIKNGGVLNIPAGTIIRSEGNASATPANWASIVVQRGGKINAIGTASMPVVFTSNKAVDNRKPGDWGGIIILGKATNNLPGGQAGCTNCAKGEALVEGPFGFPDAAYGGNDDADNSGEIVYTRIEFPGMVFAANNEINGLTLGSVGYGTNLHHIQISLSNDDSYEWFGGAVNSRHIVAFKGTDDDFDTDFGYHGFNQFGIGFKDSLHFDPTWNVSGGSTSEGFESDNDGSGSTNTPQTSAIFSNFTMVGPYAEGETYSNHSATVKGAYRRGARIRRNSAQSIVNSIFMGYRNGLMLDGAATLTNANIAAGPTATDALWFRNNIFTGMALSPVSLTANSIIELATGGDTAAVTAWFKKAGNANRINPVMWAKDKLLTAPNNYTAPNFLPIAGSVALSGANFDDTKTPNVLSVTKATINGSIKVYPNPSNGVAHVELNLMNNSNLNISILSVDGKLVKYLNDSYPAGQSVVNVQGLNQGVYFVKVAEGVSFNTFKLIVK